MSKLIRNRQFLISYCTTIYATRVSEVHLDFHGLAHFVRNGEHRASKDGLGVIPANFKEVEGRTKKTKGQFGVFRQKHGVYQVQFAAFDIEDHSWPKWREDVVRQLGDFNYLAYTTFSHGDVDSGKWEEGKPRFRVLLPYSRPVTQDEHECITHTLDERIFDGRCDPSTDQAWRSFYTFRSRHPCPDAKRRAVFWGQSEQQLFVPESIKDLAGIELSDLVKQRRRRRNRTATQTAPAAARSQHPPAPPNRDLLSTCTSWTGRELIGALTALKQTKDIRDHAAYADWFAVAVSLKDWAWKTDRDADALRYFLAWSRGAHNYDPMSCEDLWEELDALEFPGTRTIDHLMKEAMKAGWRR